MHPPLRLVLTLGNLKKKKSNYCPSPACRSPARLPLQSVQLALCPAGQGLAPRHSRAARAGRARGGVRQPRAPSLCCHLAKGTRKHLTLQGGTHAGSSGARQLLLSSSSAQARGSPALRPRCRARVKGHGSSTGRIRYY